MTRDAQEKMKIKLRWGKRELSNIINVLWCFFQRAFKKFLVRMSQNLRKGAKQVAEKIHRKTFPCHTPKYKPNGKLVGKIRIRS